MNLPTVALNVCNADMSSVAIGVAPLTEPQADEKMALVLETFKVALVPAMVVSVAACPRSRLELPADKSAGVGDVQSHPVCQVGVVVVAYNVAVGQRGNGRAETAVHSVVEIGGHDGIRSPPKGERPPPR